MREPVIFAGEYYYPAGPAIHFLPNEMVPSGLYRGVPLYSRTTIEPNSIVFIPIAGGMMQPYERRRTGDLVGTTGSSAPALPVDMDSPSTYAAQFRPGLRSSHRLLFRAAGGAYASDLLSRSRETLPSRASYANRSTAMAGRVSPSRSTKARDTSKGSLEFQNERWYARRGRALDQRRWKQIGVDGFPVYARDSNGSTIYIPVTKGADAYAAYSKRK
jgi:hypothetical protein